MEKHLVEAKLQPLIIGDHRLNLYGDQKDPSIDYALCEKLLGLPLSFLMLTLQETDWSCYEDYTEGARDTIEETLGLFKSIPVGKDLRGFAPAYFEWLLNEDTFGARKYSVELGALLPATLECLKSGRADDALHERIIQFAVDAEQKYVTMYKQDVKAAVRWSRAGRIAEFLACIQRYLKDGTAVLQESVEHFFTAHVGYQDDRPGHEVINMMREKLSSLLGTPTVWLGLICPW